MVENEVVKVNKALAEKLFYLGFVVELNPSRMVYNNYIGLMVRIYNNEESKDFIKLVNSFEYYNCNTQTGKYAAYYINEALNRNVITRCREEIVFCSNCIEKDKESILELKKLIQKKVNVSKNIEELSKVTERVRVVKMRLNELGSINRL